MAKTLDKWIKDFEYERGSLVDGIRNTTKGDCDDFAWSLLVKMKGSEQKALKALISQEAELWRVRSPTNVANGDPARHVALWVKGYGWIDSTERKWRKTVAPHKKAWKMRMITVIPMIVWGGTAGEVIE